MDRSQQQDLIEAFIKSLISCYDTQICDAWSGRIHIHRIVRTKRGVRCDCIKITLFKEYKEP